MKRIFLHYIFLTVLFISCNNNQNINEIKLSDIKFINKINISYEKINTNFLFSYPECILLTNNYLIIQDDRGHDFYYHVVSRYTDSLEFEFGKKGRGPEEFLSITYNPFYDNPNNEIQIFDPNEKKIHYYEINNNNTTTNDISNIAKENGIFIRNFFDLNEFYLAMGSNNMLDDYRFAIFDTSFKLINRLEGYPILNKNKKINEKLRKELSNIAFFKISPNKKNAVFASYHIGLLQIFDLNKLPEEIINTKSLLLTKPMKNDDEYIFGFEDIYVTDYFIYTLHNGKTSKENPYYAKSIKVFDWQGNPVIEYNLGIDMRCLAIDENKKTIYAIAYTDEEGFILIQANKMIHI